MLVQLPPVFLPILSIRALLVQKVDHEKVLHPLPVIKRTLEAMYTLAMSSRHATYDNSKHCLPLSFLHLSSKSLSQFGSFLHSPLILNRGIRKITIVQWFAQDPSNRALDGCLQFYAECRVGCTGLSYHHPCDVRAARYSYAPHLDLPTRPRSQSQMKV